MHRIEALNLKKSEMALDHDEEGYALENLVIIV